MLSNISRFSRGTVSFSIFPPPDRLCTHGALYADDGGCTLSVGPRSQIGNPGFIFSDGRSAGSGHVDFRIRRAKRYVAEGQVRLDHGIFSGDWQGHSTEVG